MLSRSDKSPNLGQDKYPSYLNAYDNGRLDEVATYVFKLLEACCICPRRCRVNRLKNEKGFCRTGYLPKVYSFLSHHGEEPPISGTRGSGTIFFSGCNMSCVYCQNYEFSQQDNDRETDFKDLAGYMLKLQDMGCHNINLVTPTHLLPQILKALSIAVRGGLSIPLVYNTSGYELVNIIKLLDGIIDIYLADIRYAGNDMAAQYSNAADYPKFNQEAIKEMYRQVGIVAIDKKGIVKKGLIIRHLVLPGGIAGTEKIMKFISDELSNQTYISLMSQYTPFYKAGQYGTISRRITQQEYSQAQDIMEKYNLHNGWIQDGCGLSEFAGVNISPFGIKNTM